MIEMSIIVITPDSNATIRRLMECLAMQTARAKLEIVIGTPSVYRLEPDNEMLRSFGAACLVSGGEMLSSAVARAAGIRTATASIVVLTEDHSFPDPPWAEASIHQHT